MFTQLFPRRLALALACLPLLAGCGSSSSWQPTATSPEMARQECDATVDQQIAVRGLSRQAAPGDLQARYRDDLLSACMHSKGYEMR